MSGAFREELVLKMCHYAVKLLVKYYLRFSVYPAIFLVLKKRM